MVHELDFAHVRGLVDAYAMLAEVEGVQSCELDLDQLRLTFTTRFPLAEPTRRALHLAGDLVSARCWPTPAPLFAFSGAVAEASRASGQSAIDSSTSMTGMPSSTG